jgi:superfamily II DNA or RNA helicase
VIGGGTTIAPAATFTGLAGRGQGNEAYAEFLRRKRVVDPETGITSEPSLTSALKPHQRDIVRWSLRRGRAAIFAGTGLGKTLMELTWSDQVSTFTGKPVLIFAPLAVAEQHISEAEKFGMSANLVSFHPDEGFGINVSNYQKLDHFDLSAFGGIVLDESSILKSTDGKYRTRLIQECAQIPFRLAATATPAPNDFMELGNHAEFLGVMSYTDMLATFFTHDGGDTQKWRLKGHAETEFWKWMASWAVMLRKPSDLGYDNAGYDLPPLHYHQHIVGVEYAPSIETGLLFPMEARTLQERIAARRDSVDERVALAAQMTPADGPFVWWCNLNSEADALAKAIPGAINLSGSDKDDDKRRKLVEFSQGKIRVLITKPSIAGFGMNWQHCANTGFVGLNDSFEQVYQAIRRFWRFGQTKPVNVHFIASEMEGATVANIKRKEADAERMAAAMVLHMADLSSAIVRGAVRDRPDYNPQVPMTIPAWVGESAA